MRLRLEKIRSYLGSRSLANRILLLQIVWTLFIYILVITALWFAANLIIESSVRQQGENWIAKLDEMGMPIYATNKRARLKQPLASLRKFPEIARARYLDETGKKVLAEYARKDGMANDFAPLAEEAVKKLNRTDSDQKPLLFESGGHSQMRISAPIWIKSISRDGMIDYRLGKESKEEVKTIGFIEVVLDYSKTMNVLNRNLINASMVIAAMMLVAAFVARVMVRKALKPLAELEEPLTRLANGETDVTVNTGGDEEIARIGIALNTTISALKERDEALHKLADHDALTGLMNRARFVERLEQELKRIARGGPGAALFFFDLDRFKNINDTYGHAAGDRLLIQVTRQLSQRVRDNDLFARYGGDEFTLLAYDVGPLQAGEIAESFLVLMRDFVFYEAGEAIKIYFSIGITLIDDGKLTVQEYLNEADAAVHQAKLQGRNCCRIFERATHRVPAEASGWYERLQEILGRREAILYYQRLASLRGRSESIYEVLLRLPGTGQEVICPAAFMPAAERFGLISELDRQVIGKAALILADPANSQTQFSLNLSEQFFAKGDILEFLDGVVSAQHIEPRRLIFELSQGYVARNGDKLQAVLAELARRGHRFAIDDFSADFGAFSYIRNLPVHFLKIDGPLIGRIAVDDIARIAVRAIVEAAAELNIETVAKNVSDEGSLAVLQELGVDYAQGNHIAAPSPQLSGIALAAERAVP